MTIRAGWRVGSAGMLALLLSGSVLVSGSALAQEDTASSEDQKQTATEADEVSDKATGVSDEDASFGQGAHRPRSTSAVTR